MFYMDHHQFCNCCWIYRMIAIASVFNLPHTFPIITSGC
uniref:Uncharacterized protein n=1 Tax=Rhizophora mucronata TaxID=61149 RepID=A0A2P2PP30_RHIMU